MNNKLDDEEGISKLEGIATIITKNATQSDKEQDETKELGKMAEKDPELTSSHGHIKATTTFGPTHSENNLKTSETALAGHS